MVECSDGAASACSMRAEITPSSQSSHVHRLPVVAPPVRVVLIKELLNLGVGHRPAEVHDRVPELPQGSQRLIGLLYGAGVHRQNRDVLLAVPLPREVLDAGDPAQEAQGAHLVGGIGHVLLDGTQHLARKIPGVEHEGAHHLGTHGMQPVLEGGDHPEVAAPAPNGPEQVRVLLLAGRKETSVGGDHAGGDEVVRGEAVLAPQVADAAV